MWVLILKLVKKAFLIEQVSGTYQTFIYFETLPGDTHFQILKKEESASETPRFPKPCQKILRELILVTKGLDG